MARVLIALGGNQGDVRAMIDAAIAAILNDAPAELLAASSDYATPPWGDVHQPHFVNACIEIETALDPHALLKALQSIETRLGRDRRGETRWGPRPIDLDIIAYDDLTIVTPALTLPHASLWERAFVLVPLAEIAPDRVIAGWRVGDALARLSQAGIERLPTTRNGGQISAQ